MFTPMPVYIGLRYTRAKRRNHFMSFIALSSMLGIALGVTTLITVLSVMNGFEKELRERILGMTSHATITGLSGTLGDWRALATQAREHKDVLDVAPFVEAQGMLTRGNAVRGVLVRGILPEEEPKVSALEDFLVAGDMRALVEGGFGVVLGKHVARALGSRLGTKVTLVAPKATASPAGVIPRLRRFTVVGIFEVGAAQYDSAVVLVHMSDAAKLFQLDGEASGLRIKLLEMFDAPVVSRELAQSLGGRFWVRDWSQHHSNFFRALKTEKTVMFIILTLIVAVAAFNIVSALTMAVTDKESDIAILRTLGATPGGIMKVFIVQGTVIGVVGTLLGAVGGIALASNVETIVPAIESLLGGKILSPDVYYITDVPSDMRWSDVAKITLVALVLSVLATLYPAWRASRTQPAEALRYE
ncbi:MAG: lipoprotein-releasing system transmembrane subunit LolC [Thiotrichales bacterium]|nr:lipoprotein-releasing system transmembrane subunit LolC [Thiotrichales bacterium]